MNPRHLIATGEGGVFRRTVAVDETDRRVCVLEPAAVAGGKDIATGQKLLQAPHAWQVVIHHYMEKTCCQPEGGYLVPL